MSSFVTSASFFQLAKVVYGGSKKQLPGVQRQSKKFKNVPSTAEETLLPPTSSPEARESPKEIKQLTDFFLLDLEFSLTPEQLADPLKSYQSIKGFPLMVSRSQMKETLKSVYLNSQLLSDVIICVQEEGDLEREEREKAPGAAGSSGSSIAEREREKKEGKKRVYAHKSLLAARSPYFNKLFSESSSKSDVVLLEQIGYRSLLFLLEYLYTDTIQYFDVNTDISQIKKEISTSPRPVDYYHSQVYVELTHIIIVAKYFGLPHLLDLGEIWICQLITKQVTANGILSLDLDDVINTAQRIGAPKMEMFALNFGVNENYPELIKKNAQKRHVKKGN